MGTTDKVYFAGLVDGEGYIFILNSCVGQSKKYLKMGVKIQMVVDESGILAKAKELWGGHLYFRKGRKTQHRDTAEWIIENDGANKFLKDTLPYLRLKKQQAEIGLEFRKFVSYNNNITDNVQKYRLHLMDGLKGLHHSIPFAIDQKLRKVALHDIKTKHFISQETRQRLSDSHKGQVHAGTFKKGCIPWTKGRKFTEEHKRKIGLANSIALKKYYAKIK